jgi:hypothetical protein
MKYSLSRHAEWELSRRQISRAPLESALANPEQRLQQPNGTEIRQSRSILGMGNAVTESDSIIGEGSHLVVTAYRTSKVDKYWRPE